MLLDAYNEIAEAIQVSKWRWVNVTTLQHLVLWRCLISRSMCRGALSLKQLSCGTDVNC